MNRVIDSTLESTPSVKVEVPKDLPALTSVTVSTPEGTEKLLIVTSDGTIISKVSCVTTDIRKLCQTKTTSWP